MLNLARAVLDDLEVAGGDILTDTASFTFPFLNAAFRKVQIALAAVGVETMAAEAWLIGVPAVPTVDPEARVIVDDTGTRIVYPNGVGNVFQGTPQLPTNLIVPLKLWERQNGTNNFTGPPMVQSNDGLLNMNQQTWLVDWQWMSDGLYFRGALQVQDVKMRFEKELAQLSAPTDPVPIRGVLSAAAFELAATFVESRGGALDASPSWQKRIDDEFHLLKAVAARRRQRKQVRRQPYSGRSGNTQFPLA